MDTGDTPSGGAAAESGTVRPGPTRPGGQRPAPAAAPRRGQPKSAAAATKGPGSARTGWLGLPQPRWALIWPPAAVAVLAGMWGRKPTTVLALAVAVVLAGAVLAAVQHAEVVAHRVGEPFGSLVLPIAVTVIEVGLIVTLMVSGGAATATLARDTVFAAVMITCNGIVGLSFFAAWRVAA